MSVECKGRISHDGESYEPGEVIEKISEEEAQRLVDLGVAFFVPGKGRISAQTNENTPPDKHNNGESKPPTNDDDPFEGIELADLKEAAKEAGVNFNANIGFETLVERIKEEGKVEDVLAQFDDGDE